MTTSTGISSPDSPAAPGSFHLRTLGTVGLYAPDGSLRLGPGLPLALLTYLKAMPGQSARREHLADTFWATSDASHSRQALRQTLTRLRVVLGPEAFDDQHSELHLRVPLAADFLQFVDAVETREFDRALSLYEGEFFPEYGSPGSADFEQWVDVERERFRRLFLRIAEAAGRDALDRGASREAVLLGRRMQWEVPASQAGTRLLLEALLATGNQDLARAEADLALGKLREAGRDPEAATIRVIQSLDNPARIPREDPSPEGDLLAALVGREREFRSLIDAWNQARQGPAIEVCITGAAGLGKTRLLKDFCLRLKTLGARFLAARALPGERGLDFALVGDLVGALAEMPGAKGVSHQSAAVLVGINPALSATYPQQPAPASDNAIHRRALAVLDLVRAVADEAPLALLIDDLHWADEASLQVLSFLAGRLGGVRVMLVTASRPSDHALDPALCGLRLHLAPLPPADIQDLIESLATFPPGATWGPRVAEILQQTTAGSPLLVLETLRLSIEEGDLLRTDGVWETAEPEKMLRRLAQSDVLALRLASLPKEARHLLLCLAVAGVPLTDEEVAAVGGDKEPLGLLEQAGSCHHSRAGWESTHDELSAAALRLATPEESAQAHLTIGRLFGERATGLLGFRRAAAHLLQGGGHQDLELLVRRWIAAARRTGDQRGARTLVTDLLGDLTPASEVRRFTRRVPLSLRWGRQRVAVTAAMAVLAGSVAALANAGRTPEAPPDAVLVVPSRPSGSNSSLILAQISVRRREWSGVDTIRPNRTTRATTLTSKRGDWPLTPIGSEGRLVYPESWPDSGGVDLTLRESDGTLRRLTHARGDDIDPSPSPDGRYLVFSTGRWRGPASQDLAILDLESSTVRRLTHGPGRDTSPQWSPDGTRVAFLRYHPEEDASHLCWTTVDAVTTRCGPTAVSPDGRVHAWSGPLHIIFDEASDGFYRLAIMRLWPEEDQVPLDSTATGRFVVSPDGRWALTLPGTRAPGEEQYFFPLDAPSQRTIFLSPSADSPSPFWLPSPSLHQAVDRLRVTSGSAPLSVGVPHRVRVEALQSTGEVLGLDPRVQRWSSSDTTVVSILSNGWVMPKRIGHAWLHVLAGGWREDSIPLVVEKGTREDLYTEDWADTTLTGWETFGTPRPRVVSRADGTRAFLNNGDETFESGAVSVIGFDASAGLGLEAEVSTPVTAPIWQQLKLSLESGSRAADDFILSDLRCGITYPAGEGKRLVDSAKVSAGGMAGIEISSMGFRSPGPYTVQIQIFPDGTCGLAIDGTPVWRSADPVIDPRETFQVVIAGHSVGTEILVGRLVMWRGMKAETDWAALPPVLRP